LVEAGWASGNLTTFSHREHRAEIKRTLLRRIYDIQYLPPWVRAKGYLAAQQGTRNIEVRRPTKSAEIRLLDADFADNADLKLLDRITHAPTVLSAGHGGIIRLGRLYEPAVEAINNPYTKRVPKA
jgi:hypothetical protein